MGGRSPWGTPVLYCVRPEWGIYSPEAPRNEVQGTGGCNLGVPNGGFIRRVFSGAREASRMGDSLGAPSQTRRKVPDLGTSHRQPPGPPTQSFFQREPQLLSSSWAGTHASGAGIPGTGGIWLNISLAINHSWVGGGGGWWWLEGVGESAWAVGLRGAGADCRIGSGGWA